MLDQVMCSRSQRTPNIVSDTYDPSKAITKQLLLNPSGKDLVILFPPWHNGGRIFDHLAIRIARAGRAVLHHNFADEILQADTATVIASFRQIRDEVSYNVNGLAPQYRTIHLFGASLGNVSMAYTATRLDNFDSAQTVVAGSDLATCTLDGLRTQSIRHEFEQAGITRTDLIESWHEIAPATSAFAFSNRPVSAVISARDNVISTESQIELLKAFDATGAKLNTRITKLGHYATVAQFCTSGVIAGS